MARSFLAVVLTVVLCGGSQAAADTGCDAGLPAHIRVVNCRLARALQDGLERSESLRNLVQRLGELRGIIYVSTPAWLTIRRVQGALSHHITSTGATRILHIAVLNRNEYDDRMIATLGHELRHALEVLDSPDTKTERDVDELFERIGNLRGPGIVETDAAQAMGDIVRKELSTARNREASRKEKQMKRVER